MEAHSLASLNLLAQNPPQYPENPSEEKREPVVLYISRVPGTRDVILSPFKPQLKNVTGEDVASSLYYVHYELPSADLSGYSPGRDNGRRTSSEETSPVRTIPRKPLPSPITSWNLESPADNNPQLRFESVPDSQATPPPSYLNVPQPLLNHDQTSPSRSRASTTSSIGPPPDLLVSIPKRKPLGPRPLGSASNDSPDQLLPPRIQDQPPVEGHIRTSYQARNRANSTGVVRNSRSLSPKKRTEYLTPPFALCLIRRDPGTGDQWNVGRISSHEIESLADRYDHSTSYTSIESQSSQYPPIDLQIETSGYARFRSMPSKRSIAEATVGSRVSMDGARYDNGMYFSRQVSMSYSKSWTSTLKSKFHQIEQATRKKAHSRQESETSADSAVAIDLPVGSPPSTQPERLKARGYVFSSPWDTKCEFRTGNGGRSLLCHNIQNESQTSAYNPLVADSASNAPKPTAAIVSELRFNLPGADLLPSNNSARDFKDRQLGHFNKLLKDSAGIDLLERDDDDDVVSPFELNVGSENAGGGNRGKRAKLGKLIIHHEGLKMLDLLVAANMGMWWSVWERRF